MEAVFQCKMCGTCCQGRGGIVLSAKDLSRLAAFLHLSEEDTVAKYAEHCNGKLRIRSDADGCCFFRSGTGCTVHEGKPDICRAWPFFRGNMLDPISFAQAKEFCAGINPTVDFATFRAIGMAQLTAQGLLAADDDMAANALRISTKDMGA